MDKKRLSVLFSCLLATGLASAEVKQVDYDFSETTKDCSSATVNLKTGRGGSFFHGKSKLTEAKAVALVRNKAKTVRGPVIVCLNGGRSSGAEAMRLLSNFVGLDVSMLVHQDKGWTAIKIVDTKTMAD